MNVFDCAIKKWREATAEEMEALETADTPTEYEPTINPDPTAEERISDLEEALELILSGVTA